MVDKIKPLKLENPALGGTQTDFGPTEADPSEDYLATKGIAFENLDTFRIEKFGRAIVEVFPQMSILTSYLANGELDFVEWYSGVVQTTPNRIARSDLIYTGVDPTSESMKLYDTNGTTVLRTYTWTHSYTGVDLTNTVLTHA